MKIAHYRWFTHAKWWSSRARLLDRLENIGVFSIFLDGDFQEATNESVQLSKEIWYDIDLGSKDYDVRILENYIWWCNDLGILEMKLMMIVVGLKLMMILEVKLIPVMILEVKLMMWAYVTVTCHIIYIYIHISYNPILRIVVKFMTMSSKKILFESFWVRWPRIWVAVWNWLPLDPVVCLLMSIEIAGVSMVLVPHVSTVQNPSVIPWNTGWLIGIPPLDYCNPQ